MNERIRAREVRVIDEEGQMVGVMSSAQALALARERNVDLVEVSPMANPPVCKLLDWGRFKYEQAKRENEARKNQKTVELKEIRMRPRTDEHDLSVKVRKIEEFLAEGNKVKVGIIFRGREMAHPELGRSVLDKVIEGLKGIGAIERPPLMEGKMMSMIVSRPTGAEAREARRAAPPASVASPSAQQRPTPAHATPTAPVSAPTQAPAAPAPRQPEPAAPTA